MTDLTKGIIEINGFTFRPGTKIDEVLAFFGDKVRVLELSTGPRVKLSKRFHIADGIYAYNFDFSPAGILQSFGLVPVPPAEMEGKYDEIARYMVSSSKRWLKNMIQEAPTSEGEESVLYAYDWGYIRSATREDPHYGLIGGEMKMMFIGG